MAQHLLLDVDVLCDLFDDRAWKELKLEYPHARFCICAASLIELYGAMEEMGRADVFFERLNWLVTDENFEVCLIDAEILLECLSLLFESQDQRQTSKTRAVWLAATLKCKRRDQPDTFIYTQNPGEYINLVPSDAIIDP